MEKTYKDLATYASSLDEVIMDLHNASEPSQFNFNGKIINSDMTEDECYITVLGKTKSEWDEDQRKWKEEYQRKEAEHKAKIPEICEAYFNEALRLIREDQLDFFKKILPIRVGDIYHGLEVRCTLDIIKELKTAPNREAALDAAEKLFESQGHSGMSAGLVLSMVMTFSPVYGVEFNERIRTKH